MSKVLGLFPGQGSQKVGMGKSLVEQHALAREMFENADRVLGFSLSSICFDGPEDRLTATEIAQPAILTVSSIAYRLSQSSAESAPSLVAAAGHSLGEYSALVAAGALRFEDAVLLVHKRGRYMQEAVPKGTGKMIAVLGKELAELESCTTKVTLGVAEIANINAPGQIVVAGDVKGITQFLEILGPAKSVELQVSAPFHCSLMKPAAERLAVDLAKIEIAPAQFPIYANVRGAAVQQPDQIRKALADQVCGRVRWIECMQRAIEEQKPDRSVEFGAGNVLSGMLKRICSTLPRESFPT